ncbi:dephospho-CoA kinase [Anaerococcus tetradius]|jgi:hypothetical protein|uniref:Dephospho-CoA kinase n=2 Tax=Anaerococcus tetradius TaxID=33036 RepID=C2CGS4_9FIRM|nr:dephospho-CoA kinase [Anaerococcus tetradius]EEI83338.1 dephospho-CoA kinase [Anaerococcus tetradius ATCC 35098]KWZ75785.1 dephospho-CoA kinase [Anaerococcus tetradius]
MNPSRIVITGIIASGKSTLCDILRQKGFLVIDADQVNKKLIKEGGKNYLAIKSDEVFAPAFDGEKLDKKKLAQLIFADKEKMDRLNELSHKNIIEEIDSIIDKSSRDKVFIEIPLFFQMKETFPCDKIILVTAKRDVQIQRLIKRDGISLTYAKKKIESQDELERMKENSDIIIDNSDGVDKLKEEIEKILDRGDF